MSLEGREGERGPGWVTSLVGCRQQRAGNKTKDDACSHQFDSVYNECDRDTVVKIVDWGDEA